MGHSKVYRRDDVPLGVLGVEAARLAIADAGLEAADIDGISIAPGQAFEGAGSVDGLHELSAGFLVEALGLDVCWVDDRQIMVTHSLVAALHAVAGGGCRHALVVRALHNPSGRYGSTDPAQVGGYAQFTAPYGFFNNAAFAFDYRRYMHKYGAKREQMGRFVVRNREQALLWEHGYWYQSNAGPLTLDDYMTSRMIAEPLCIHDCDLPVQAAGAFVVTSAERAVDLPHPPAYVVGTAIAAPTQRPIQARAGTGRETLEDWLGSATDMARHLWANAGLGPDDADVINLYDGYSIMTPLWAEAAGFCKEGEAFDFIESPPLPLNTSSGSLGSGRTHGIAQIMDGALQVMGRSGPRQIPGAEISVVLIAPPSVGVGLVFGRSASY